MRNDRFSQALHQEMRDVHVSPSLRQRTLDAVYEKEQIVVKKKISFAMVAAVMTIMISTVALAMTGSAGLQDFFGRYVNTFVPAQMGEHTQNNVSYAANELVSVSVRELYYDGRTAHMTVDVTPKKQGVLLLNANIGVWDSWQKLITVDDLQIDPTDTRTIADAYAQLGYTQAYRVNMDIYNEKRENVGSQMDYVLGEDGTLTYYMEAEFGTDDAERIAQLDVMLVPYADVQQNRTSLDWEARTVLEHRFTMTAAEYAFEAYICDTPTVFPSAGVRVDRLLIEVRPQELLYTIAYTYLEPNDDSKMVWFEFIEPAADGVSADRALMDGVNTSAHNRSVDSSGCQSGALGRNELHDAYTLRAYDRHGDALYSAKTFAMRPATYEEVEVFNAEMADMAPIMPGVTPTVVPGVTPLPEDAIREIEVVTALDIDLGITPTPAPVQVPEGMTLEEIQREEMERAQYIVPGVTPLPTNDPQWSDAFYGTAVEVTSVPVQSEVVYQWITPSPTLDPAEWVSYDVLPTPTPTPVRVNPTPTVTPMPTVAPTPTVTPMPPLNPTPTAAPVG